MFGLGERPDARAFRELIAALTRYERKFRWQRFLRGDNEIAEGYRAMLDILSTGLECFVHTTPSSPRFVSLVSPDRKLGGDNADALYYFAPLHPGATYRITGTLGGAIYLGFTVYGGKDAKKFHIVANASTPDVTVNADGTFEVRVTPAPVGPNDVRTDPTTNCVIIRRYYLDKEAMAHDPGTQRITPDVPAEAAPLLTADAMAGQIRLLTSFLEGWFRLTPMPMPPVPIAYNKFIPPRVASTDTGHWSTPDNVHAFGLYRVRDDEALLIRGRSPECIYWSVHLWNAYMQTFDYVHHRCALNSEDVTLDADGRFELCIASRNPGHPNWIDTTGHPRGFVYFRWLKAKEVPGKLEARVVAI